MLYQQRLWTCALVALVTCLFGTVSIHDAAAQANDAYWIWSPNHPSHQVPEGHCFFRRTFRLIHPVQGEMVIAADDQYEIYINGDLVDVGEGYEQLQRINITSYITNGENVIAIKVENATGNTAALATQLRIKHNGSREWSYLSSNETWKTETRRTDLWKATYLNDKEWVNAQSIGVLGETLPWDESRMSATMLHRARAQSVSVKKEKIPSDRFQLPEKFSVDKVLGSQAGSIIAMEFNEFGKLIISEEGGPLKLVDLTSKSTDGTPQTRVLCDLVNTCQGNLAAQW